MKASSDYAEMLRALNDTEARYLVVGAYAVAHHAEPRFTKDLDLWIDSTPANATRVLAALRAFGAPTADLDERDLQTPELVYQIGVAPVRIDILTDIDGVSFDDAWADRKVHDLAGVQVPVISRHHLLINKKSTGRPKDLADAAWLEERSGD